MMNMMEINGYRAIIQYDPEIEMFRGEFVDLNSGADFYAKDIDGLRREGELSLNVFLEMCSEDKGGRT
jgi:predicted HicB family RNase H-like nuclease